MKNHSLEHCWTDVSPVPEQQDGWKKLTSEVRRLMWCTYDECSEVQEHTQQGEDWLVNKIMELFSSQIETAKKEEAKETIEKLKDICNRCKTEKGLSRAISNFITTHLISL